MDLQNIQNQLNTEFAKSETRIIFWFDDKDIDYINEKVLDTHLHLQISALTSLHFFLNPCHNYIYKIIQLHLT